MVLEEWIDVYRGAKNLDIPRMQVFYHRDDALSETSIHMSREGSGAAFLIGPKIPVPSNSV